MQVSKSMRSVRAIAMITLKQTGHQTPARFWWGHIYEAAAANTSNSTTRQSPVTSHRSVYTLSLKKNVQLCCSPYLRQVLTDFQIFFTGTLSVKVAVVGLLKIQSHLNCVATLPCKT